MSCPSSYREMREVVEALDAETNFATAFRWGLVRQKLADQSRHHWEMFVARTSWGVPSVYRNF